MGAELHVGAAYSDLSASDADRAVSNIQSQRRDHKSNGDTGEYSIVKGSL